MGGKFSPPLYYLTNLTVSILQKVETNKSDLERLANRAADYMIETMQLFQHHDPGEFIESEKEKLEKIITRLQRFVDVKCLYCQ